MSSARVCDVCHEVIKGEFLKSARLVEWVWGGWSLFSDRRKIDVCGSCLEKIGAAVRAEHLAEKRHPSKPPEPPNVVFKANKQPIEEPVEQWRKDAE